MVHGFSRRFMTPTANDGARQSQQQPSRGRKPRAAVWIAQHLDALRAAKSSNEVRDALADMAMCLINPEERDEFEGFDGPTMIVNHLNRMTEEQATLKFAWETSSTFGTVWESYEVRESLVFTVVVICHASIEETIAQQCIELGATRLLWELYVTLPTPLLVEVHPLLFSALRNLSYVRPTPGTFPHALVLECWRLLTGGSDMEMQVLSSETLTNLASHNAAYASPTPERLSSLLSLFFNLEDPFPRIAVLDLLCNLTVDPSVCLLVIYELDTRKPHRYRHHSGVVYFLDLTEAERDSALRQAMEALAHNLSWSDPTGKRTIQKLGLSSYMARFALEPAINN